MRHYKLLITLSIIVSMLLAGTALTVYADGDTQYTERIDYTGQVVEWVAPYTGEYVFTLVGGQGGGMIWNNDLGKWVQGGAGGKTVMTVKAKAGEVLYLNVGGAGHWEQGGYNGGGSATNGYGGGGATTIAIRKTGSGQLKDYISEYNILGVAGGGGGLNPQQKWVNPTLPDEVYVINNSGDYESIKVETFYKSIDDTTFEIVDWESNWSGDIYKKNDNGSFTKLDYNIFVETIYSKSGTTYTEITDKGHYENTASTNGAPGNTDTEDTDSKLFGYGQDSVNGGAGGAGLAGGYASDNITWEFVYRTTAWRYITELQNILTDNDIDIPFIENDTPEIYEQKMLDLMTQHNISRDKYLIDYSNALHSKDHQEMWKIYTTYLDKEEDWKNQIYGNIDKFNPATGSGGSGYAFIGTIDEIYSTGTMGNEDLKDYTDKNNKPVEENGYIDIQYNGGDKVKLTIQLNDSGTYPGYTGDVTIELDPYEEYTLESCVPDGNIQFLGYVPLSMYNDTLPLKRVNNQVQYTDKGVAIMVDGSNFTGGSTIKLTWADETIEAVWFDPDSVGGFNRVETYTYQGHVWQSFTAEEEGLYKIEAWGGKGGDNWGKTAEGSPRDSWQGYPRLDWHYIIANGGGGGYSVGNYYMKEGQTIWFIVGGAAGTDNTDRDYRLGKYSAPGFPFGATGGGRIGEYTYRGYYAASFGGGGGGATCVVTNKPVEDANKFSLEVYKPKESWYEWQSQAYPYGNSELLLVAGGGGGAAKDVHSGDIKDKDNMWGWGHHGGAGGGITGGDGEPHHKSYFFGYGGGVSLGESKGSSTCYGESNVGNIDAGEGCAGGGGGWYGGGPGNGWHDNSGAGGGSGYNGLGGSMASGVNFGDGMVKITEAMVTYRIKYNLSGGETNNPTTYNKKTPTFTLTDPWRPGYIFKGWIEAGTTSAKPTITIPQGSKGDKEFTAVWEPITYTVNIYQNAPIDYTSHGHSVKVTPISSIENKSITTAENQGKWEDKYGSKWSYVRGSNAHFTKTFVYDSTVLNNTDEFYNLTGWLPDNNYMYTIGGVNGEVSGDKHPVDQSNRWNLTTTNKAVINLYPNWIKNTYYIDYSGNDTELNIYGDTVTTKFSGKVETTVCRYDTDVTIATDEGFKKPGYEFKEWNTKSDGTGTTYTSGQYLVKPDLLSTNKDRMTLYAIWEPKIYGIEFHPDASKIIDWDPKYPEYTAQIRFDSIVDIKLPDAELLGQALIGWSKDKQPDFGSGDYGKLDLDRFYYKGDNKISVSNNREMKSEADVHFNPFTEDLDLYTWFNRKPIFIDIYEGLFFEGQEITYTDLLELVRAWDYEDNYLEMQQQNIKNYFESKINRIDQDIDTDEDIEEYLVAKLDELIYERPDSSEIDDLNVQLEELRDHLHKLFEEKEYIEQQEEKILESLPDRAQLLPLNIAEIDYLSNGVTFDYRDMTESGLTSNGLYKAINNGDYDSKYLKTGTAFIGDLDITYQVHDEGIAYKDMDGNTEYIPNSDITMEYARRCKINFNYNPLMYTQGIIIYSVDNIDDFGEYIKAYQASFDTEDVENNIPWWSKYEASSSTTGEVLHMDKNQNTITKLQDSIIITGVQNFKFGSAFEYENKQAIDKFIEQFTSKEGDDLDKYTSLGKYHKKGIGDIDIVDKSSLLNEIYSFKDNSDEFYNGVTKAEIYKAMQGMDITFDSVDQWGKWASNNVTSGKYNDTDDTDGTPGKVDTDRKPDGFTPENNGGYEVPDDLDDDNWDDTITQEEPERTVPIIIVNNGNDSLFADNDMFQGLIRDRIRYINNDWLTSLGLSYWGTSGLETLEDILEKNLESVTEHSGTYETTNKDKVEVIIKDYTK